ncbi:MAG: 1,4-alpha-glucan branching protein GlgB [Clostridiales bacterium]|nr:1,4-alpha-glucan branching protein GlgB [Clostridiales bacterium]
MIQNISQHKYLFHHGANYRSYEFLGAHAAEGGYLFRVWAPRADAISVVGSFNDWKLDAHPMKPLADDREIWEAFVPGASVNDLYKFAVTAVHPNGEKKTVWKADPFAFFAENGGDPDSQRASIVYDISGEQDPAAAFAWSDEDWMQTRKSRNIYKAPVNIYEVHLGSWRRHKEGRPLTYRETADSLIAYAKEMGYTHIELLPVMEHPFDGSWGYQVTGYYSPTSRYGRPEDLKYLIDTAHRSGIGVILDWVPAHFPKDEYGLVEFDGQPLYEYTDKLKAEHKGWGTLAFDFGRPEVISFLVSNAFYWCEQFHADGLRVDAVAAMIYLNYGREDGDWMPNEKGGVENLEAIKFLQRMNQDVLTNFPGVITIAEESTAWPNITKPPHDGGLGFNFKWNMGWMNDELEYFESDPLFRRDIHGKLIFSLDYAWSENFILPISHDEVVHGKKSLLDKMPGEYDRKFDGFRTFLAYMITHPGKKLTFMGTEFAQFIEWNEAQELDWLLLDYDRHRQTQAFVRDLNGMYLREPALWIGDDVPDGFQWIDGGNINDNVITFIRKHPDARAADSDLLVICLNLSGKDLEHYKVGVPAGKEYAAVIDTDDTSYGGQGKRTASTYKVLPDGWNGYENHIELSLPALSAIVLKQKEDE